MRSAAIEERLRTDKGGRLSSVTRRYRAGRSLAHRAHSKGSTPQSSSRNASDKQPDASTLIFTSEPTITKHSAAGIPAPPYRTMRRNRPAGRAPFDREQDKNPAASTGCRSCRRQTFGTTAPTGGLHRNRFHRAGRTPVRAGRTRTRHRRRRSGAVAPGAGTATFADETTRAGRAAVRRTKNR